MIIYLDMIFLENLILNSIILFCVCIISKSKIKIIKIMLASLFGSIYAVLYYLFLLKFQLKIYLDIIMKILLSIAMVYISFSPKSLNECIKKIVYFYLTSFVFGGGALGAIYLVNSGRITIKEGIIVDNYTIWTIIIGILIAFGIIIISFKLIKSKISKNDLFCSITIKFNHKEIKARAILDTGNFLKDPITNIPVIVVEHNLFNGIINKEILDNIENILGGDLKNISDKTKNEYISKLKVIPFSSIGKQNGIILGIKSDGVLIEQENDIKKIEKVIIGLYNNKLSKNGDYNALLGIGIL